MLTLRYTRFLQENFSQFMQSGIDEALFEFEFDKYAFDSEKVDID